MLLFRKAGRPGPQNKCAGIESELSMEHRLQNMSPEEVVERYSNLVYRLAFSQMRGTNEAEDVYQEVFFRYFRKNPEFRSEEHRKAWLLRVTLNCCKKQWAAPWRKRNVPLDEAKNLPVFSDPEETGLRESLLRLPSSYRAVLHLFYYEDMTVEETARALGRKPSTVRAQLTRARRMLKDYFEEET